MSPRTPSNALPADPAPDEVPALPSVAAQPPATGTILQLGAKKRPSRSRAVERRKRVGDHPRSVLWYGDNLKVLREHVADASVDLVYLDPPFNSNRAYNVLFRGPDGAGATAQIRAFKDTWRWNDSTREALRDLREATTETVRERITPEMRRAAATAGEYRSPNGYGYPKIQLMTVHDVLKDLVPELPGQERQQRRPDTRPGRHRREGDQLSIWP